MVPPKKTKCARCKGYAKGQAAYKHTTLACTAPQGPINRMWDDYPLGESFEAPVDKQACRDAINSATRNGTYNGEPYTKNVLEALHKNADGDTPLDETVDTQIADKKSGSKNSDKPAADTKSTDDTMQIDTQSATQQGSNFQPGPSKNAEPEGRKIAEGEWSTDFRYPEGLAESVDFRTSSNAFMNPNQRFIDKNTESIQVAGGFSTTVMTNYVAIKSLPPKVYVYSVSYGGVMAASETYEKPEPPTSAEASALDNVAELSEALPLGEESMHDQSTEYVVAGPAAQLGERDLLEGLVDYEGWKTLEDHEDKLIGKLNSDDEGFGADYELARNIIEARRAGESHIGKDSITRGAAKRALNLCELDRNGNQLRHAPSPSQLEPSSDMAPTDAAAPSRAREIKRRGEKRCVFDALRELAPFKGRSNWATDYLTVWSLEPLQGPDAKPIEGEEYPVYNVDFSKPTGRPAKLEFVQFRFQYELDFPSDANATSLLNPPGGQDHATLGASVHIAALNGLISKQATECRTGVIQVGPNKFFLSNGFSGMQHPASRQGLPLAPFNVHRGYYSSVRPGSSKALVNVSTKAGTFHNPMKVSTFLDSVEHPKYKWYGDRTKLLLARSHDEDFNPNTESNRHKTIVEFGRRPQDEDCMTKDGMMSVMDYFTNVLKADPPPNEKYPCVNVGAKTRPVSKSDGKKKSTQDDKPEPRPIWIPADLLELDAEQPFSKALSPYNMEQMLEHARHTPDVMQLRIADEGLTTLGLTQASAATSLVKIEPGLLQIPARMLNSPIIAYRGPHTVSAAEASWYMHNGNGTDPVTFYKTPGTALPQGIHVLDFCTGSTRGHVDKLAESFTSRLEEHGIRFTANRPTGFSDINARPEEFESDDELRQHIDKLSGDGKQWPSSQIFLVLLDDTDSENYARVKRVFDQILGLHTVCLTAPKLIDKRTGEYSAPKPGLFTNLGLKVNLKLRGQNHQVSTGSVTARTFESAFVKLQKDTIVLGADVSHAPSQMDCCPSVAAVVGSIDGDFATFAGSIRLQASKQEEIEDLADMVKERVIAYTLTHPSKQVPAHMIFYRDGVGEDQFDCARTKEIERVKHGFKLARSELKKMNIQPAIKIPVGELNLTFIVVGKRHHTRFFPPKDDEKYVDDNGNMKPGLVVDSVITRPQNVENKTQAKIFDFFLQSHAALKGTAKSAHYIVLEQGKHMSANKIQTLTHNFCYNYARAAKGVSYAGPAYYADRLADRGTHYLRGYTSVNLDPDQDWDMTEQDDINAFSNGQDPMDVYKKRVADGISASLEYNPNPTNTDGSKRKNPWHERFDKVMFWL
ncbi:hypothetical protein LTR10_009332 [Elasticomyces elasticus]|nr:hypothetical protein LTR10_009332 [Elasticomyces elasticus]KAK4971568.1 hypothetical protein LTR42_007296 [Elasticomyces elasticus]